MINVLSNCSILELPRMAYNKRGNIKGTTHEFLSEPKEQDLELTRANCKHL